MCKSIFFWSSERCLLSKLHRRLGRLKGLYIPVPAVCRMFLCRTVCHINLVLVSSALKSLSAGSPDLEIRGGPDHPDPQIRGGGGLAKKFFSVWSKNKGGPNPSRPPPPLGPPRSLLQLDGKASGLLNRRLWVRLFGVLGFFLSIRLCHSLRASSPGHSGEGAEKEGELATSL